MSAIPNFSSSQIATEALRNELLIRSLIQDARTAILVKVMAVHPGSGSPPTIGTVDVQPLVSTVDGSGKKWLLGVTYGAPFGRIQFGGTGIIADPAVNDIGLAVACDRDISSVLALGAVLATPSNSQIPGPGSRRTHNISDLVYVMSIISAASITQYLQLTASLLKAVFPNINLNGVAIDSEGTLTAPIVSSGNGATGSGNNVTVENGIVTSVS